MCLAFGCGRGPEIERTLTLGPDATADGRNAYRDMCASCHGADGHGDGPNAAAQSQRPTDLTQLAAHNGGVYPRAEVTQVVSGQRDIAAHGGRDLVVWGSKLRPVDSGPAAVAALETTRRAALLVDYIGTLQAKAPPPAPAPAPAPAP